jgi:alcohol dehydrogenase class IV
MLPALVREALARALAAPHGDHHAMTLAGVLAYYTSHPGAREGEAAEIARAVRIELSPTVWPALAVMRLWRAAKHVGALAHRRKENAGGRATEAPESDRGVE